MDFQQFNLDFFKSFFALSIIRSDLNPWRNEKKFWDFDWADMGMKDIPASLDYITALTGYQKVAYIGHS